MMFKEFLTEAALVLFAHRAELQFVVHLVGDIKLERPLLGAQYNAGNLNIHLIKSLFISE